MLTGDEPELEAHIPDEMPEEYLTMRIPPPFEHNSPEHMAQWMIERLSKRLVKHVEAGNVQKVKIYVERRQIMTSVLNTCRRDPMQRPNALYMMNSILDISDDESENASSNTTGPSTVHSPSVLEMKPGLQMAMEKDKTKEKRKWFRHGLTRSQ